jgi:hypothetical protein
MAIIAKASAGGESFVPAPIGFHRAICCDVVDLGMVQGQYGTKHKVRIIWQTEALMPDGKPYLVDQRYTLSLDERSNLRRDLESWRGKTFTLSEAAGFDLERLLNVQCSLMIVHKPGREAGKVFANIQAVLPAQAGKPLTVRDYVRVIARNNGQAQPAPIGPSYAPPPTMSEPAPDPFGPTPPPMTHEDIPF